MKKKKLIEGLPYANDIVDLAVRLKLSPYEQLLLHNLRAPMNGKNKTCWLKQSTLAKRMGVSRSTVNKCLDHLKHLGILILSKKRNSGKFDNSVYEFIYPWKIQAIDKSPCPSHTHGSHSPCPSHRVRDNHTADSHTAETDTNISKSTNRTKKEKIIDQSINRGDGLKDSKNSKPKNVSKAKDLNSEVRKSENLKAEISADSFLDFERHGAAPPAATEEQLKKFYHGKVPKAIDLTVPPENGKVSLSQFTKPFNDGKILCELYGQAFNEPLAEIFEKQIDDFYATAIRLFWQKDKQPGGGFRTIFFRAARAGVLRRLGLNFKTPQQLQEEQKQREAREKAKKEEIRKLEAQKALEAANREKAKEQAMQVYQSLCEAEQRDIREDYEFSPTRFKMPFPDFLVSKTSMLN